jgi:hypothetical protein
VAVTSSVRAVLTGPGALAARGQMILKVRRASRASSACFLKVGLEAEGKDMNDEKSRSGGSTMKQLRKGIR